MLRWTVLFVSMFGTSVSRDEIAQGLNPVLAPDPTLAVFSRSSSVDSETSPSLTASALLSAFDEAAFLLDLGGRLRALNGSADRFMRHRAFVQIRDGRLHAAESGSHLRLKLALGRLADQASRGVGVSGTARGSVRLVDPVSPAERVVLGLGLLSVAPAGAVDAHFVLARVHDPDAAVEVDRDLLAGLFDLTPAEARITALLCQGHRPTDIAAMSRVALGTVRTQLKAVFSKTGTSRQAELVRLVTALPKGPRRADGEG